MLQNKKLIQIVISAILALVFVNFYLKSKEQSIENDYGMIEVLVAATDVPPRTLLSPPLLTIQRVPRKFVQPGAFMVKIPQQALDRIKGKITIAAVPAGTQITQANLMDPSGPGSGVAPVIPPGKRAFLLRLGNTEVADLILPGDHVDVMATFSVRKDDTTSKATYTILQNILVMSVGKVIKRPTEGATSKAEVVEALNLTVAVEPVEAERLALAQSESQGEISIVVRPPGDSDIRPVPGVTPGHLLNSQSGK